MIAAILLSGGKGTRMGSSTPKQYLFLDEKPLILHSLEALLSYPSWSEIIVVCEPQYLEIFSPYKALGLRFALPGKRRQDSVFSAMELLSPSTQSVCIHDGARPFLSPSDLSAVIEAGLFHAAAALATPIKTTIKEADADLWVTKTVPREFLWSIQTPQVLSVDLLQQGRLYVQTYNLCVTDDVSLAELLGHRVKLVPGSEFNWKITTLEDLTLARLLLQTPYV